MTRLAKLAFAIGAHSPLVVVPVSLVGMLFFFPPGPVASPEQGRAIEEAWRAFGIAMGVSLLAFLATLVWALVHLFRDPAAGAGARAAWTLGLLLLGGILLPAYFWARILPSRSGDEGIRP